MYGRSRERLSMRDDVLLFIQLSGESGEEARGLGPLLNLKPPGTFQVMAERNGANTTAQGPRY